MKILHYVSHFSLASETFIYDLITALSTSSTDEHFILTHYRFLEKERPYSNLKIIPISTNRIKRGIDKFLYPLTNKKAAKWIDNYQPDKIHSHYGTNGVRMQQILKYSKFNVSKKIAQVVSFHGMDINKLPFTNPNYKKNLIELSKNVNVDFVCPSLFLKNKIIDLVGETKAVNIIPNSVNPYFFQEINEDKFEEETFQLLNVGRLSSVKGQIYLVQAMSDLVKLIPTIHLSLVGTGELEKYLQQEIKRLNLTSYITLLGRVAHNELPSIYKKSHLYIQPSIVNAEKEEENSPISVLEALSLGVYPIVSTIGGMPEIINNVGGAKVEQKKPEDLVEQIVFLYRNKELLKDFAKFAPQKTKELYSFEVQCRLLNNLYKK